MGSHAKPSHAEIVLSTMRGSGRVLFANATSLIASTGLTSALGVVYWFVAAHAFSIQAVGLASAGVSAMVLLATLGSLGQGTYLLGELRLRPHNEGLPLIGSGLAVTAVIGTALAFGYAAIGAEVLRSFSPFESPLGALIFALGVAIMAMTMVADDVTIALLRGGVQLWRNGIFGVAKLVFLVALTLLVAHGSGIDIYVVWTAGALVSLVFVAGIAIWDWGWRTVLDLRPRWRVVKHTWRSIAAHQMLNLSLRAGLVLPAFVLAVLGASYAASFYIAWQIAGFVITVPTSFSTVLYAIGRSEGRRLPSKMRQSLLTCVAVGAASTVFVVLAGAWILTIFGRIYAHQATVALWFLTAGVFGTTMKDHYVVLARIHNRIREALPLLYFGTFLELAFALIGAIMGGLTGLAAGWLVATLTEAALMSRRVLGATRESNTVSQDRDYPPAERASRLRPGRRRTLDKGKRPPSPEEASGGRSLGHGHGRDVRAAYSGRGARHREP